MPSWRTSPCTGPVGDGVAAVRALIAISQSVKTGEPVRLKTCKESVNGTRDLCKRCFKENVKMCWRRFAHGMHCTQFNLVCLGMPPFPQKLDIPAVEAGASSGRVIKVSALSGTST